MKNEGKSPCLTCTRVKAPENCENKCCRVWQNWFLARWDRMHGYYEKYIGKEGEQNELEK